MGRAALVPRRRSAFLAVRLGIIRQPYALAKVPAAHRINNNDMSHPIPPSEASRLPVVYVHAKGRARVDSDEVRALLDLGCTVCSRMPIEGVVQTGHGYGEPVGLIQELAKRYPGRPVLIIRAGLKPSAEQLASLAAVQAQSNRPMALTMLTNADPQLNPFAGLNAPENEPDYEPGELVSLLAPGHLHTLAHWSDHFALISAEAVAQIAGCEPGGTLMQRLSDIGGRLALPDFLFLRDDQSGLYKARVLQPHESLYPPPFGDLSARLQAWMDAGVDRLPFETSRAKNVTLHITHSWGGGVAHWVSSFIGADSDGAHYQLRAEGPQSDQGCGQRLVLYAGNELRSPVASWWLQPPIRSVENSDEEYRALIEKICRRYRVGRVIVSSLIGHTLDALRTGLPTLQVLHDHFPLWPLLSVHPDPFLREGRSVDIEAALASKPGKQEFEDKDAAAWVAIREAYLDTLAEHRVSVAAPGQSVLDMQARLEPAFDTQGAAVIPHGSEVPEAHRAIDARPREDHRMRMVVLGRIQTGKGQKLLLEAIGALAGHVQIYLLGSGKSGEEFFGLPGVDVVPAYDHAELPAILREIGPHFAALLSIVPETFSYTLSELQLLGIPAIATRVGSFPDRIVHGETGWLIDANPAALIEQVKALCESPADIGKVRSKLAAVKVSTLEDMLSAYQDLIPLADTPEAFVPVEPGAAQAQFAASDYQRTLAGQALEDSQAQESELRQELASRTEKMGRDLRVQRDNLTRLIEERTEWALNTKRHLEREHEVRITVEAALADTRSALSTLRIQHERLSNQYALVIGSTSWKITRPLRAARRVAKSFLVERAWNPLRWPRLIAAFFSNLSRFGIVGALSRMQYEGGGATAPKPTGGTLSAAPPEQAAAAPDAQTDDVAEPECSVPEAPDEPDVAPDPPASFPEFEKPDASIIVPVYNKWPYTAACLKSLAENTGKYTFEVIVVDDGSSDESGQAIPAIEGLTYIQNEKNLGFVGSCNKGAARARGEYLVMLNNDTEVTPGWLDELIDTLEHEPGAGLVGARLVYPNGLLQEVGGIIFSDGSGWNYGREQAVERPEFNFLREVDYCSGACIALRTELFHRLGAFDEKYAPAYYEDTDLAFRVREAGLKVFVQPASTVIHHEGITSGTDLSSGMKRYQRVNQKTFVERWRKELASQPRPVIAAADPAGMRAASQHRVRGRVLFIGTAASASGPELSRMQKSREGGFAVTFLTGDPEISGTQVAALQKSGVEVLHGPWAAVAEALVGEQGSPFDYLFVLGRGVAEDYRNLAGIMESPD